MASFLLLAALLLTVAAWVRRSAAVNAVNALANGLNGWVITVALPATILEWVPSLRPQADFWFLVTSQWLLAIVSALLFRWLGNRLGWTRSRIGAVTLLAGFSNTAFLGYPLLEALRGGGAVALGVVADELGCFMALAVGGAMVIAIYSGEQPSARTIIRRVVQFPPFLAVAAGLIMGALGGWPAIVPPVLHRLAQTLAPLALFSVGLRLQLRTPRDQRWAAGIALGWKLGLMPLLVWVTGRSLGVHGLTLTVGVLETAMAPMFTAAILARQNNFDPPLTDTVLSLGMLLSFLTVPAWSLLLP